MFVPSVYIIKEEKEMYTSGLSYLTIFILGICIFYFLGVIYLSKKNNVLLGLILPLIFGGISAYYALKPMLVYNPYPTMKEGIYMTFFGFLSIVGFVIFLFIRYGLRRKSQTR